MENEQSRIARLNKVQEEASEAWINAGGIGTLKLAVGLGKTITAFKCLYRALDMGWISKGDTVRFMAETNARSITLFEDELPKFRELFGKDPERDFDIRFECYQGMRPAHDVALDILDEIHDTLSEKYFINVKESAAKYRIGLTGAMSENSNVFRSKISEDVRDYVFQGKKATEAGKITELITKGEMLDVLCPVVYGMDMSTAIDSGLLSPFTTTVITHRLDDSAPYRSLWKSTPNRIVSEKTYYTERARIMYDYTANGAKKRNMGRAMAEMLYALPSKIPPAMQLIANLEGPTVVFGKYLNFLDKVVGTENVVRDLDTIRRFNDGETKVIGSVRKIKQGITLQGVENMILLGYDSKSHNLQQMIGRVIRFSPGKRARVFIMVTDHTLENKWFKKMQNIYDSMGRKVGSVDLNITGYVDSRQLMLDPAGAISK